MISQAASEQTKVSALLAFKGLTAIVQYRRKPERGQDIWHTMAAFDSEEVANRYAKDCSGNSMPWEYRVALVEGKP